MHEAVDWIRANAIPLTAVEAGNGFADLERLRAMIGGSRIVSLGEATHGTREFFELKHRLLEFCVSELDFTIFGIEASYPECLRINDYVLHGTGKPADALAGQRFWTWDTEELLALIEWMRAWNRKHERQVKFYGFDMQFPTEAALGVLEYLKRVAPRLASVSEDPLWALSDDFCADRFHLLPASTRDAAQSCIRDILAAFAAERPAWIDATSELEWQLARLNAVVLEQSARLRLARSNGAPGMSRDVAMAENVAALLQIEGPRSKAVLWAHNGHVAREYLHEKALVPTMGRTLHDLFGTDHFVIGFAFNRGAFQAIEWGRGLVDHAVGAAPADSLDGTLASAGIGALLLDLSSAPAVGPIADWLATPPLSRWIGAVYSAEHAERYFESIDPRRAFNALAFVESTTAARATIAGGRSHSSKQALQPTASNLELDGGDIPDSWEWSETRAEHAYKAGAGGEPSPAGRRTVKIARASAPWRWGEARLEQAFSAESWRGKRLRFSAAVRAEVQGPGTGAQLYVEVRQKPPEGMPWLRSATAMSILDRPVRRSTWRSYVVEIDIPDTAPSVVIGLALAGDGAAWFGDLELKCA